MKRVFENKENENLSNNILSLLIIIIYEKKFKMTPHTSIYTNMSPFITQNC